MAAENVIAMSLRMRNSTKRAVDDLSAGVKSVGISVKSMGTTFGTALKTTRTSAANLMGTMISLKGLIIATFAYRAIQKFGRFLVSLGALYKEQEASTKKLSLALAAQGNYTEAGVKSLSKYATQLQMITGLSDDTIQAQMTLLATYGMSEKEIREAILPAIDLHIAKNIELQSAVNLVGKSFVGYTATLSRFGIIIDKTLSASEKYAAVLKNLSQYSGISVGLLETYGGKVSLIGTMWKEIKESLGGVFARGIEQSEVLDVILSQFISWNKWLVKNKEALGALASTSLVSLKKSIEEVIRALKSESVIAWAITFKEAFNIVGNASEILVRRLSLGMSGIQKLLIITTQSAYIGLGTLRMVLDPRYWFADEKGQQKYKDPLISMLQIRKDAIKDFWDYYGKEGSYASDRGYENAMNIGESFRKIAEAWSAESKGTLWENINEQLGETNQKLIMQGNITKDNILNQQKYANEVKNTFEFTKSMAKQYALSSKMEQEQVKYMISLLPQLKPGDIGKLNELQRELINSQGVLQDLYKDLMGKFTQQELTGAIGAKTRDGNVTFEREDLFEDEGLRDEFNKTTDEFSKLNASLQRVIGNEDNRRVVVKVGFTGKAEELLAVRELEERRAYSRDVERMAG